MFNNKQLWIVALAIISGVIASIMVSRMMTPFNVINQTLTFGDREIKVVPDPGDQITGVLTPGQMVDVVVVENKPDGGKNLKLVAELVQFVGEDISAKPADSSEVAQLKVRLRVTKEQADVLQPFEERGALRFIVRKPVIKQ